MNWRAAELRSEVEHLKAWVSKEEKASALGSVLSALNNAQMLGRE